MAERTCTIPGCGKPLNCRGYCKGHYYRWSRYGDPLASAAPRPPAPPRPKRPCIVDGCDRPRYGRGLCEPHYARQRRHGGLHDERAARRNVHVRFWEKVDTSDRDGCWPWTAGRNGSGYGVFNLDGRPRGAHVAVLLLAGIPIPSGHEPDHLCRTRHCVRPDHLEVVTATENKRRARAA